MEIELETYEYNCVHLSPENNNSYLSKFLVESNNQKETHVEFSVEIYLALTLRCKGYFIPIRNLKFYWEIDDNDHSKKEPLSPPDHSKKEPLSPPDHSKKEPLSPPDLKKMKNEHPILFEMAFYYLEKKFQKVLQKFTYNDLWLKNYFGSELKDFLQKLITGPKNYSSCHFQPENDKEDFVVQSTKKLKSWHVSSRFITGIEKCASMNAICPDRLDEARQKCRSIIGDIVEKLKTNNIEVTPEFFGRASEDFPSEKCEREFDVMLVYNVIGTVEKIPSPIADLCFMMVKSGKSIPIPTVTDKDDHNRYLIPSFLLKYFKEKIDMCCGEYDREHWNIKTELRGQSILMKVSIQQGVDVGVLEFSIDICPTLKVDNEFYVCNHYDKFGRSFIWGKDLFSWRKTYSINETELIFQFTPEKQDHKKILHVFKFINDYYKPFEKSLSYYFKITVLKTLSKHQDECRSKKRLGLMLIDWLNSLVTFLKDRHLPCFFQQDDEQLIVIDGEYILKYRHLLQRLIDEEDFMMEILEKTTN
ncbi:hypothetical protein HELRODRAFT_183965 [Helobdella robusta]|uniref:Uncharacterized protein n=1 Tax=Helobdella robusta TaxID=6412 RepID=T1FKD2_HELRO|nr:hypothetical protein HELRODRAFT_183965 [Helobdella robusta]ESO09698.1 hypothetical protein HELRODRAFT_183965 [Helobdella robusta]